jgi:hypothetical protein
MSAITGSAHSRYAGLLLPIEPSEDFLRPIDLVPLPDGQTAVRKRLRARACFLILLSTGVPVTLLWQSCGDAAREMIANSYRQVGWFAPRPAPTAQNPHHPDAIALAAPALAGQEPTTRSADQTATSVDQAPAAKGSGVTVEGRADGASSRLAIKPTEVEPQQTLSEKRKLLSAASGQDAYCFPSSSAVLQNHPEGWPTWTLRAPGHEGTMCWYAAARPRGSDRRRVGMTENGLSAPPARRPQWWGFGLP